MREGSKGTEGRRGEGGWQMQGTTRETGKREPWRRRERVYEEAKEIKTHLGGNFLEALNACTAGSGWRC